MKTYSWWSKSERDDGEARWEATCGSFYLLIDAMPGGGFTAGVTFSVNRDVRFEVGSGTFGSLAKAKEFIGSMILPELERMTAFTKALVVHNPPWVD